MSAAAAVETTTSTAADCLTKPRKRAWREGGLIIIDNGQLGGELV